MRLHKISRADLVELFPKLFPEEAGDQGGDIEVRLLPPLYWVDPDHAHKRALIEERFGLPHPFEPDPTILPIAEGGSWTR